MPDRKIAVVGCGSIGGILTDFIERDQAGRTNLLSLFDKERTKAQELADEVSFSVEVAEGIDDILGDERIDLVVEVASQRAVSEYAVDVLSSGKDLVVLSIGALADRDLFESIKSAAIENGAKVYLSSGAIIGLDGIQAASMAGLDDVKLTTRKPTDTLAKTKYVRENGISLSDLDENKTVFEGSAAEAVKAFPSSINVAAALSIAGAGFDKTKVEIVADPSLNQNVHEIRAEGDAGEFLTEAHNKPSPENPKTSYLAALSVVRTLKNLTESIQIGT